MFRTTCRTIALLASLAITAASALATPISGPAEVVDGDTLYVGDIKIRLQGIDAPEWNRPGGRRATRVLVALVGTSDIRCDLTGEVTHDRMVGVCFNATGRDLAAEVIRAGAALDCARYSGGRYRSLEPVGVRSRLVQAKYC